MSINRLIEDAEMEKALDYLRDNARAIGQARENMILTEKMTKHVMAIEIKKGEGAFNLRENEARASEAYLKAITEEAKAAGKFEEMKALREAAAAKLDCWRSEQATLRGIKI